MILVSLSCALFGIGMFGVLVRRDIVAVLASVEVMLAGPLVLLVAFGSSAKPTEALSRVGGTAPELVQAIALLVIVVAAAEAAVGLALLVTVARRSGATAFEDITEVRG
jgi:NADH-quinone oxidoreductase subunit K